jgi:hypothetical protein
MPKIPRRQEVGDSVVKANASIFCRELYPFARLSFVHEDKIARTVHRYAPAVLSGQTEANIAPREVSKLLPAKNENPG